MQTIKVKHIFLFLIKLLLTIGLLGWIISKIDADLILKTFVTPNFTYLILAFFLILPNFLLKIFKWNILLRECNIFTSIIDVSESYLAGITFGLLTPARAGEIGRVLFLGTDVKLRGVGVVIIDKLIDLTGILLISLFSIKVIFSQYSFITLFIIVFAGIISFSTVKYFSSRIIAIIPNTAFGSKIREVILCMDLITTKTIIVNLFFTFIMYFIILLQCHILIKAFYNIPISFNIILLTFPLVILSNIAPVTIGGIGVREGVAVLCLSFFHIPSEVAITATFYLFILNVVMPSFLGAIIIFHYYFKHKKL